MRKQNSRVLVLAAGLLLGGLSVSRGQKIEMEIMSGGLADAEAYLQAYLKPFANIIGSNLNAGWYNTARPHELGGLDISATVSWAKAPTSALNFNLNTLELNGQIAPAASTVVPTVAGQQDDRPSLIYSTSFDPGNGSIREIELARIRVPDGAGIDNFPLPMGQISVGLPFGTDLSARFVPLIEVSDYGEIGLWGVGGKHSISQWLPFIKRLNFLDVSVQGGYTQVTSAAHVQVEPNLPEGGYDPNPSYNWEDQYIIQKVEGWTLNLVVSQTLPVVTFYQAVGYASSQVDLLAQGHFPVLSVLTEGDNAGSVSYNTFEDPIELRYENFDQLRLNAGVRIKLGLFTLHYDFTKSLYATHSVGIGVSFR
ncbi:MAG: hypothetical protein CSA96_07670 [Bacteroidetes bacterium]|nr:MAG: hypothetical protein CSA96_07670 [Bacteroidota bacterium]